MKKRIIGFVLAGCMLVSVFAGCGSAKSSSTQNQDNNLVKNTEAALEETSDTDGAWVFTDSLGREITFEGKVTKIAVSGPLSQIYILPLAGDMLVGVSNAYAEDMQKYLPPYLYELQEIGQLYGGKGEMDLEALLAADPDAVIDIGEAKGSIAEDLDSLGEQTGIPFIHIDATVLTAGDAYRLLGKLLDREEEAENLASWCEGVLAQTNALMEKVDADGARKKVLYCLGDDGTNVLAQGSYHAETVNLMTENLAVLEDVVSSGAGNEVDLEQILNWNPEVIIFAPESIYDTVGDSAQWQSLTAVANGDYYETPYGPYGWLSSPPSVQRYLGILWLGELLYPEYVEYDLQEQVTEYYKLFYSCDLTDEMYQELVRYSLHSS